MCISFPVQFFILSIATAVKNTKLKILILNVFIQVVFFSVTPVEIECRMISAGEFGQKELANLYFDILENEQKNKTCREAKKEWFK